jgi:ribulose-phosphate 3-epimerase
MPMAAARPDPRLYADARRLLVEPSVLSADFTQLGEECRRSLAAGGDAIHFDVMDGHFVPNLSMGPAVCAAVRRAVPGAFIDTHLMCTDPGAFVEAFAKAGTNHVSFHVEAVPDPRALIRRIRDLGMAVGCALNPDTPADAIGAWIAELDSVLVMSVHPGYSGQAFIPGVLDKVPALRARMRPDQRIAIDGGVSPATAPACRAAGCDVLVAASAIFGAPDMAAAIRAIRGE